MRNLLLTSTAAVCLVLAGQAVHAQNEHQKKDEVKQEHVQQQQQKHEQQAQEQQKQGSTGQAADEKKNESKKNASSPAEKKDQNAASKPSSETNKNAQTEKSKRDENKKAAEEQKHNATPSKSTASEHNKANESAKPATAEAPKSSTQQKQENASTPSSNTNATNSKNTNTTNNATKNTTDKATTNTANQTQPSSKAAAVQVDPQKKVQISETISKHHDLAAPVKNLNISITVGERVPTHVHLHRLPREIVTIAPEYRDYEYFTTEEDVVIVSPRTHEIVTRIPRDVSRARAEVNGGSSTTISSSTSGGATPCQVMQRTASGDMKPVDPSQLRQTTGSGGSNDRLAVRVQAPNGQTMPEITLPDREGRIIAETNGNGCRVILDPGPLHQ